MAEENIDKILARHDENVKRHMDVLKEHFEEHFDDKIHLVSEQVVANTEKLTILQKDMNTVKDVLETIKFDIEFIKNELVQKVSREEFAFLEKRVALLESKFNQNR